MNLYVAFTFMRWTVEFSLGFSRTLDFVIAVRDVSVDQLDPMGTVYGTLQPDGTFVPDGVSIEDQNTTG